MGDEVRGLVFHYAVFPSRPSPCGAHYQSVMKLTMGIWCAYPVMFLVCEMSHMVSSDVEVWMYCVLDVAAKCGCGFLLVSGHEKESKTVTGGRYGAIDEVA